MNKKLQTLLIAGLLSLSPALMAQTTTKTGKDATRTAKTDKAAATPAATAAEIADAKAKGLVWVNLGTGVYHLNSGDNYGTTKRGKFMTEADAQKGGYRAAKSGSVKKAKTDKAAPSAQKK